MRRLLVLGSTGSVGCNTLDVAARHRDRIEIVALAARCDDQTMFEQIRVFAPRCVALVEAAAADRLRERLRQAGMNCEVLQGDGAIETLASDPESDTVMAAIVGAAGLASTRCAIVAGKRVLIANKEPLVMAGTMMMTEAAAHGATIIPIDSEHNAIFQCLPDHYRCGQAAEGVRRLILTASGGPFRDTPLEKLCTVTPEQAVRHPNWSMGPKISVDSSTLMNKGLELIEASVLYRLPAEALDVVIHPESIVHSLVEYVDGSTLAQLGQPDMRVPIAHALAWPERWSSGVGGLDLAALGRLRFAAPDPIRFPCLQLARHALAAAGVLPNVLNAANEIAVQAFLQGRIGFMQIAATVEQCCDAAVVADLPTPADIPAVLQVDAWARHHALGVLSRRTLNA